MGDFPYYDLGKTTPQIRQNPFEMPSQYEAVYEINLDYLMSLNGHADVFGIWWDRRNADLHFVLNSWQYDKYVALSHFYRPVAWKAGSWTFAVYTHYNRGRFYNAHPTVFVTYKGGHNRVHGSHYAHMHRPATHHHAPAVHHHAQARNSSPRSCCASSRSGSASR